MRSITLPILAVFFLAALSLPVFDAEAASDLANVEQMSESEIMKLGEKMYREGILPSGKPMEAFIRGDVEVDSTAFSCSSCHLRAGLGSYEGGVITPPTNGKKLYAPYRRPPSMGDSQDRAGRYIYAKTVVERPAYDRESLAYSLRFGIDPAGQTFNDVMPRYPLSERDMGILVRYLELLSSKPSPGAGGTEFNFATIITDDVGNDDREALLNPIRLFIKQKNQQMALYKEFLKFDYSPTIDMKYAFHNATLDIWELSGAPDTWGSQLHEYLKKKPVFAVLGGISNKSWQPVHDFCEEQRLPCLFPITDLPVVSDRDWYTFYFNKGFYQEGEALARYLNRHETYSGTSRIIQIVEDSEKGKALAAGFNRGWGELDRPAVTTVTLTATELNNFALIGRLLAKENPSVILLWTGDTVLTALPELLKPYGNGVTLFMSAGYLGQNVLKTDQSLRDRVYFTYPYRLTPYVGIKEGGRDARVPILATAKDLGNRRITSRTVSMLQQVALRGLNLIYDNHYRDHLLDVMGMQMDLIVNDYERLSFGPGQRFASKGCYVLKLGKGESPELIPVSEWVIH
ncbi:MAG: amino acid ABC transporter substrate-binding protein [Geobacter sp.]|nr:amino acid ABC transporter substrate-binding protein [Geobacter sp.]